MSRSLIGPMLLIGGGAAVAGAIYYGYRKSEKTSDDVEKALAGLDGPPVGPDPETGAPSSGGGFVKVRATGYWPFVEGLSATERKMEGGTKDRKGKPLYTLEMHLTDPVKYPYVSVSGDDAIWPYGQKITIDAWPGSIFRVVDTGGHFRGTGKVYRVLGYEPLDIAVNSSKTVVPKLVTAKIYPGDNFAGGKTVAASKFKDQTVVVGTRRSV